MSPSSWSKALLMARVPPLSRATKTNQPRRAVRGRAWKPTARRVPRRKWAVMMGHSMGRRWSR
jgi:hypothetical protein